MVAHRKPKWILLRKKCHNRRSVEYGRLPDLEASCDAWFEMDHPWKLCRKCATCAWHGRRGKWLARAICAALASIHDTRAFLQKRRNDDR